MDKNILKKAKEIDQQIFNCSYDVEILTDLNSKVSIMVKHYPEPKLREFSEYTYVPISKELTATIIALIVAEKEGKRTELQKEFSTL